MVLAADVDEPARCGPLVDASHRPIRTASTSSSTARPPLEADAFGTAATPGDRRSSRPSCHPRSSALLHLSSARRRREPPRWVMHSSISSVLGGLGSVARTPVPTRCSTPSPHRGATTGSASTGTRGTTPARPERPRMPHPIQPRRGPGCVPAAARRPRRTPVVVVGRRPRRSLRHGWVGGPRRRATGQRRGAAPPSEPVGAVRANRRTDTERTLAEIWARASRASPVGVHDRFVDLGGHSLLAVQVAVGDPRSLPDRDAGAAVVPGTDRVGAGAARRDARARRESGRADGRRRADGAAAPCRSGRWRSGRARPMSTGPRTRPRPATATSTTTSRADSTARASATRRSSSTTATSADGNDEGDEATPMCPRASSTPARYGSRSSSSGRPHSTAGGARRRLRPRRHRRRCSPRSSTSAEPRSASTSRPRPSRSADARTATRPARFEVGDAEHLPVRRRRVRRRHQHRVLAHLPRTCARSSRRSRRVLVGRAAGSSTPTCCPSTVGSRCTCCSINSVSTSTTTATSPPNVLASCDEVAAARTGRRSASADAMIDNFLAVPGSAVYEQMRTRRVGVPHPAEHPPRLTASEIASAGYLHGRSQFR